MYADWTSRIAAGELPSAAPQRPQGKERNVVITMWDWSDPKVYLHDEIASDKRNPTVNANGPIYGALEESADYLAVVDPKTHTASQIKLAPRDPATPSSGDQPPAAPSPYWDDEAIWNSKTTVHSFAMDKQGARLGRGARAQAADAGMVPGRFGSPVGEADADQSGAARADHVRPQDEADDDDRHLLHVGHVNVDENDVLWSSFGPAGIEGWFDIKAWDKDARREAGAGVERVRARQQRQRQA
jgi:hypothetical protein